MLFRLSALALTFLLTTPAWSAADTPSDTAAPPSGAGVEVVSDRDGKICKSDKETGTRLKRKKVCMTKQEWEETRQNARKQMDSYERQDAPPALPSGGG